MRTCPRCDEVIGDSATACRCGWKNREKKKDQAPVHIQCAYEMCPTSAIVKVKTATGWAKLCERHDIQPIQAAADAKCIAMGLTTVAEKRAWIKANFGRTFKPLAPDQIERNREIARELILREPGQDDEERNQCTL